MSATVRVAFCLFFLFWGASAKSSVYVKEIIFLGVVGLVVLVSGSLLAPSLGGGKEQPVMGSLPLCGGMWEESFRDGSTPPECGWRCWRGALQR